MQEYTQRSAQRGANGGAATLPTVEELQQIITDLGRDDDDAVRSHMRASLQSFEQLRRIEQLRVMEENSRLRLSPSEEEKSAARILPAKAGDHIASVGCDVGLDQSADAEEEGEEEEVEEDSGIQFSPNQVDEF